ncbi:PKS-NRPS hybrid synthetase cheA-like [Mercurialis annua]|uniref:PKS-NRPS hybrid synthetase cheA-like n=1 Tax=Mercurialis annua TaxID=3986 RepID=UPI00215FF8DA|nr:PKS-NRPS hybrid synthetase cheA-like [Mercurialis annua]
MDMGNLLDEDQEVQSPYFRSYKSCKIEYITICNEPDCEWKLRASRNKKSSVFIVRKFNNVHTCKVGERMADKRQATYDLVGNFIKDKYSNFKTRGLDLTKGHPTDSYQLLPSYLHALKTTNRGSVAELERREDRFVYVFISLNASIRGWGYCKPIIVVDGTFLKAAYGGTLLTAASQDAANKIFPLAFCVVDSENDASWEWFFNKLRETFGVREGMCIISDRHDSISKEIEKVFPEAHHGICTYHLFKNVKAR